MAAVRIKKKERERERANGAARRGEAGGAADSRRSLLGLESPMEMVCGTRVMRANYALARSTTRMASKIRSRRACSARFRNFLNTVATQRSGTNGVRRGSKNSRRAVVISFARGAGGAANVSSTVSTSSAFEGEYRDGTVNLAGDDEDGASTSRAGSPLMGFSQQTVSILLLNLGAVLCGSNQVVIKATEDTMQPAELTFVRFLIATLVSAPYVR